MTKPPAKLVIIGAKEKAAKKYIAIIVVFVARMIRGQPLRHVK